MRAAREIALGSAFAALFAWVVFTAAAWEPETATFPLLIGAAGLGLSLWAVAGDLLRKRSASTGGAGTAGAEKKGGMEGSRNAPATAAGAGTVGARSAAGDKTRARAAFAWIAVFFALVLLMGFRWGLPLAVLGYYRAEARVGWVAAVAAALAGAAFLHLAVAYLHLSLYRGFVIQP